MKTIIILSGGMDSVTALYAAVEAGFDVKAITFNYNQKHKREIKMAKKTCEALSIEHKIIDVSFLYSLLSNSTLTKGGKVPEGHYEEKSMKSTVVPNRNMIFASIAIGYAINENFESITLGVHAGDHAIYPDCRPEFIKALKKTAELADYKQIEVLTPFLNFTKTDILKEGITFKVDYKNTLTCYNGKKKACGKCGSCQERLEAFNNLKIKDPIKYV